jgi:hypothetical protein
VRVLFDQGTPVPLRNYLPEHKVATAAKMGWSTLSNGELLDAAEREFDLLVTTDQALRTQQDLSKRQDRDSGFALRELAEAGAECRKDCLASCDHADRRICRDCSGANSFSLHVEVAPRLEAVAHVQKDTLAKTVQWWKHLRPHWKRRQQRRERVASAKLIRAEFAEQIERKKN